MSNLIERKKAIRAVAADLMANAVLRSADASNNIRDWIPMAEDILSIVPTVDAVPVVRCGECRYGHRFFDVINGTTDSWIECRNPDGLNRDTSEDSFCSAGEWKDGEDEKAD